MGFAALTVGQFVALFGAAATAITALYLLKQQRRRVVVAFVGLWDQAVLSDRATRLFSRLRHPLSWLIALIIAGLLTLAAAEPVFTEKISDLQHTVILIDTGITMQADEGGRTRLDIALDHARHMVRTLTPSARIQIVQLDRDATPLSPMTGDAHVLEAALSDLHASDVRTDLAAGLALASDVLRDRAHAEIVVISDGSTLDPAAVATTPSPPVRQIRVGERTRDVGLSAVAIRRHALDRGRSELLIEVQNLSDHPESVELVLEGDGAVIDIQALSLSGAEQRRVVYDEITGVNTTLRARLRVADPDADTLLANNVGHALIPERRRTRVLCVTTGNRYLEAALLLDEYLQVDIVPPTDYVAGTEHDVVVFDRYVPAVMPTVASIYIRPEPAAGGAGPLRVSGMIPRPYFDVVRRDHALVRNVALRDVNIASALLLATEPSDVTIGADRRGPLLITGTRQGVPFVAFAFDIVDSDLPLRVAWPVLLLNAIDGFGHSPEDFQESYVAGARSVFPPVDGAADATWTDSSGATFPAAHHDDRPVIDFRRAGLYTLRASNVTRVVAVNAAAVTSIAPRSIVPSVSDSAPPTTSTATRGTTPLWVYVLFAAAILVAIEWFTYHRRWTA